MNPLKNITLSPSTTLGGLVGVVVGSVCSQVLPAVAQYCGAQPNQMWQVGGMLLGIVASALLKDFQNWQSTIDKRAAQAQVAVPAPTTPDNKAISGGAKIALFIVGLTLALPALGQATGTTVGGNTGSNAAPVAVAVPATNGCGLVLTTAEAELLGNPCWTVHSAFSVVGVRYSFKTEQLSSNVNATMNAAFDYKHCVALAVGAGFVSGPTRTGISYNLMAIGPAVIPGVTYVRPAVAWGQIGLFSGVPDAGVLATFVGTF